MSQVKSLKMVAAAVVLGLSLAVPATLAKSRFKEDYNICMDKAMFLVKQGQRPNYCNENFCRWRSCMRQHGKDKKHVCKGAFDNFKWCVKKNKKKQAGTVKKKYKKYSK